jgi:hypothetical protein
MVKQEQWKSSERRYTLTDLTFTKSELPEDELPISQKTGERVQPRWSQGRLKNEAATLKFITAKTSIPAPKLIGLYEEDGLLCLQTERATGVLLEELRSNVAVTHVTESLRSSILPQLRSLRHHAIGSVDASLPLIPPSRIIYRDKRSYWPRKSFPGQEFGFCHNDLGQHNIFVDPDTFRITAIID